METECSRTVMEMVKILGEIECRWKMIMEIRVETECWKVVRETLEVLVM